MRWVQLSSLQLKFREPHPVYRGLRVPLWEGGQAVYVRRLTDEDREEFIEALRLLRSLLEDLVKAWQDIGIKEDELLERVADAIALFFKSPLIMEASPVAPTPLKAHAYTLLLPERISGEVLQDPFKFAEAIANISHDTFKLVSALFDRKTSKLVFDLWTKFPADTRPGFNTSSLVAHLLLTSALAWAIEGRERAPRARLAFVRLAAMLHDLGKAIDPEKHYEASKGLVRQLLEGLIGEGALEALAKVVYEHHLVGSSLSRADRLSSAADRLTELVEKLLGEKISRLESVLGGSRDTWEFWVKAYERVEELKRAGLVREDPFKELTREFLEGLTKLRREELFKPGETLQGISLVLIDVGSVQDFIYRSQEIRVVSAGSHLIDLVVHAHFLAFLRAKGVRVPPEAVIYSGGGVILLLLPDEIAESVCDLSKEYEKEVDLDVFCAVEPFSSNYAFASRQLARRMALNKYSLKLESLEVEPMDKVCGLCFSARGDDVVNTPEGAVEACKTCAKLYRLGSEFHFRAKWESTIKAAGETFSPRDAFDEPWEEARRYIIEIIAGHDLEEIRKKTRMRDYAVIKFDGNMMGAFMLEAVSFADAVERSFRIDMALKQGYIKALEALYEGVREFAGVEEARKAVSQVYLGTVYMGGDDGLILAPSWSAPLLAHFIAEEFSRQLGLARGLSAAVTAGPARMSVWALSDCASELLKAAKNAVRKLEGGGAQVGALIFDFFEAGSPSGSSAVERLGYLSDRVAKSTLGLSEEAVKTRRFERRADSAQPYLIDLRDGRTPEAWETVFKTLFELGSWSNETSFKLHKLALGKAYLTSRLEPEEEKKRLKNLRNALLRAMSEVIDSPYWREKLYIYALRQVSRMEEAEAYNELAKLIEATLIKKGSQGLAPVADVVTLIKFTKGGAW